MDEIFETDSEAQQKELENQRRYALEDLSAVLATACGRRVIQRILAQGGLFRLSFTGNSRTFFNEGARNLSLWLYNEILATGPSRELIGDLMLITPASDE